MRKKQVTLFGATGLIGNFLLKIILDDPYFHKVILVTRKPILFKHKKLEIKIIDFSVPKKIEKSLQKSSVVFSAIGTTQAQVKGDKIAYRKIDFDITQSIALACKKMDVEKFLFVSSAGANSANSSFYLKLKGEIDDAILNLKLNSTLIFRPSLLLGKRNQFRVGEKIAQILIPLFSFLMPQKLKPVKGEHVATAMVKLSKLAEHGNRIIENDELLTL
tara:strand:- start:4859 stop:5512 length:654 start_codon:yes stop_codon:yes gene_type:complete